MSRTMLTLGFLVACLFHAVMLIPMPVHRTPATADPIPVTVRPLPADESSSTPKTVADTTPEAPTPPPDPPAALTPTEEPIRTELKSAGDYQGTVDGSHRAVLRIDWGSPEEATATVMAGNLRLITLTPQGRLSSEIRRSGSGWRRADERPGDLSGYSNRVRIVDDTPAFAAAIDLLAPGERLAVVLPLGLEHAVRTQQVRATSRAQLDPDDINVFFGRFHIAADEIVFTITGFTRRSS